MYNVHLKWFISICYSNNNKESMSLNSKLRVGLTNIPGNSEVTSDTDTCSVKSGEMAHAWGMCMHDNGACANIEMGHVHCESIEIVHVQAIILCMYKHENGACTCMTMVHVQA